MQVRFGSSLIELVQGDITLQQVDAVVNAANSSLAGGGGVDGAIHRAAGPSVMDETARRYPDGCPTGSAVLTAAGRLQARHIIHAVGPVWQGGVKGERGLLRSAYESSLRLAVEQNCNSVAFPAISTGAYGYPIDVAAEDALAATSRWLQEYGAPTTVRFVLFSAGAYAAFARVLESMT
jgi:O-acetyl-ADP-ribose deacetylase